MKWRRQLLYTYSIAHLFIILIVAFLANYSATREYLHGNALVYGKNLENDYIQKKLQKFIGMPVIYQYVTLSGTDAGYDFFAPKIGNSFVLECAEKDIKGNTVNVIYYPPSLKTAEGLQRYKSFLAGFQRNIRPLSMSDKMTCYKNVLTCIGNKIYDESPVPKSSHLTLNLFLYDFPTMDSYNKGVKPSLVSVATVDIDKSK